MKNLHEMDTERKREIVRKVLSVSKGVQNILHGEKLVNHVANSITLYEKVTQSKK